MSEREWKPIETAPDGDHNAVIDLWAQGLRYTDCQWGQPTYGRKKGVYGWVYQSGYDSDGPVAEWVPQPTHWMPLPAPPTPQDRR